MKDVEIYIDDIIRNDAFYADGEYQIDIENVLDNYMEKISALIIKNNQEYANESTGADNDSFYTHMIPSLCDILNAPKNEVAKDTFIRIWKISVCEYVKPKIIRTINERLEIFNERLTN